MNIITAVTRRWRCIFCIFAILQFPGAAVAGQFRLEAESADIFLSQSLCLQSGDGSADSWNCQSFKSPSLGYVNGSVTFKALLEKTDSAFDKWYLEIPYPVLDSIEVRHYFKNKLSSLQKGGDLIPFRERPFQHRFHVFPLDFTETGDHELRVTISSGSSLQFPMILRTPERFLQHDRISQYVHGIFLGVMLALIFYNLFLYLAVREAPYLFYVLFMISHLLAQLTFYGFSYEYLWPEAVLWNDRAPRIFVGLFSLFALLFVRSFVHLPHRESWVKIILFSAVILVFIQMILAWFAPGQLAALATSLTGIVLTGQILSLTIYAMVRGDTSAKLLLFSWGFLLSGGMLLIFKTHGIIPGNLLVDNGLLFGSIAEAILLSFGLAHRINRLKGEKAESQRDLLEHLQAMDRYKDEVNKSLERQVFERTRKIEEQSQELRHQMEMAADIQRSLLPHRLDDNRFETVFMYQPSMSVGGDFIDCRLLSQNILGLFICDVSGHGVPAALLSSMVKITLASWSDYSRSPATLLHYLHSEIKDKLGNHFLTAAAVHLNLDTGHALLSSAGHMPAVLRSRPGGVQEINSRGTMVFSWKPPQCEDVTFQMEPGQSLFLYTDGITEARDVQGQMFEEERFYDFIAREGGQLLALDERLKQVLVGFLGGPDPVYADDISLVGVKFRGPSASI